MGVSGILHDKDIREPLFDFLEEKYGKVRIIEEKRTGAARADVVMVTPQVLYGIEIKSDADTYARLKKWGIITVELDEAGRTDFYVLREAAPNPKVKDARKITILWRTELNRLLQKNGLPKYREKSKLFVQGKLLEKLTPEILWLQAYEELFERDYTTITAEIENYRRR